MLVLRGFAMMLLNCIVIIILYALFNKIKVTVQASTQMFMNDSVFICLLRFSRFLLKKKATSIARRLYR